MEFLFSQVDWQLCIMFNFISSLETQGEFFHPLVSRSRKENPWKSSLLKLVPEVEYRLTLLHFLCVKLLMFIGRSQRIFTCLVFGKLQFHSESFWSEKDICIEIYQEVSCTIRPPHITLLAFCELRSLHWESILYFYRVESVDNILIVRTWTKFKVSESETNKMILWCSDIPLAKLNYWIVIRIKWACYDLIITFDFLKNATIATCNIYTF